MECPVKELFIDQFGINPPPIWLLKHMAQCPECAETFGIVRIIQEALKNLPDEEPPFSLEGIDEVPRLWATWMTGDEPLFPCTED